MSDSWAKTDKTPTDRERAVQEQMGISLKQEETGEEKEVLIRKMMPYEEA